MQPAVVSAGMELLTAPQCCPMSSSGTRATAPWVKAPEVRPYPTYSVGTFIWSSSLSLCTGRRRRSWYVPCIEHGDMYLKSRARFLERKKQ